LFALYRKRKNKEILWNYVNNYIRSKNELVSILLIQT